MKRYQLIILPILLITGCSTLSSSRPPAPVVEAGSSAPQPTDSVPLPEEGGAEVYALREVPESAVIQSQPMPIEYPMDAEPIEPLARLEPVPSHSNNAVVALTDEAGRQQNAGDFTGAGATLERALRIEPRNPYLWNRLAQVKLEQKKFSQADNMAAKSNALAGNNTQLKQRNWLLMAKARRMSGDQAGADRARRKAGAL